MAQQIDFDIAGRRTQEVTAYQFTPWAASQNLNIKGLQISVSGKGLRTNWWKQGIQKDLRLISDGLCSEDGSVTLKIDGLKAGHHSILAYHNIVDDVKGDIPSISIEINGNKVADGIASTIRAEKTSLAGQSYVEFDTKDGESVSITYAYSPEEGKEYANSKLTINGIVLDKADPKKLAVNPYPADNDIHANADKGSITLRWQAAESAVSHNVYFGKDKNNLKKVTTTQKGEYKAEGLNSAQCYYWRIDETDADGKVSKGDVWTFRPRRLAFPGAEGYGRFAQGGRGGSVYHVTSLEDDPANPQPGTLRYGVTKVSGPRTIVFDVAGVIEIKDRLTCTDPFITVAGQTAPGKGIVMTEHPFGFASDGIFRFLRLRLGKHLDKNGKTITLDGMGAAGCDNTIIDHCSVGWTIDEAFSSRNGKNISFQHNLISETLNKAGHQNYTDAEHGYAATIGGNTGSFHHNLLAHNEGRNWSMGGGLDGAGYYAGRLDLFNNVVYNWGKRACDGGAHEVNFVGNYYKMGPATTRKYLLSADLEGTGKGTQSYFVKGNIRENFNGTCDLKTDELKGDKGERITDEEGETYRYTTKNNQVVNWKVFTDKPFFPSFANVESAEAAYHNVLSNVGANQPQIDEHDKRMINETLNGTYKYVGSRTGKKGIIDDNNDSGNDALKEYEGVNETRPANWDTDQDGMPDWYEKLTGSNPDVADNNDIANKDGYTRLEEYLNFMAESRIGTKAGGKITINLADHFAGYGKNATYSIKAFDEAKTAVSGSKATVRLAKETSNGIYTLKVTASDSKDNAQLEKTIYVIVK